MIITISGKPGAGKTFVGKELAKHLGFKFISVGELQGEIAIERGVTIGELMEAGKTDMSIHIEMDRKIEQLGKTQDNLVVEGWIAFHFIPHSKKIFLDVSENIGSERIFKDLRKDEPRQETIEETLAKLRKRINDVRESFIKYYEIDFLDKKNYDIVIDTTNMTVNETVKKIVNFLK